MLDTALIPNCWSSCRSWYN